MSVLSKVVINVDPMSLPLLPLDPTLPTGTNPPTPAAAAAMHEALGLPESEVVRAILTNLRAGDEEGAKEEACNAVSIWINLAKLHHRLDKEEAVWATLVRNVFPNAPWPAPLPVLTNKAWFYAMCKRYRDLRELLATPRMQLFLKYREVKRVEHTNYEMIKRQKQTNKNASSAKDKVAVSPLRKRRYKEARLHAWRLRQQMDSDPWDFAMQLRQAERRLTEWDPPLHPNWHAFPGGRLPDFLEGLFDPSDEPEVPSEDDDDFPLSP